MLHVNHRIIYTPATVYMHVHIKSPNDLSMTFQGHLANELAPPKKMG